MIVEHSVFSGNRLHSCIQSNELSSLSDSKLSEANDSQLSGLNYFVPGAIAMQITTHTDQVSQHTLAPSSPNLNTIISSVWTQETASDGHSYVNDLKCNEVIEKSSQGGNIP